MINDILKIEEHKNQIAAIEYCEQHKLDLYTMIWTKLPTACNQDINGLFPYQMEQDYTKRRIGKSELCLKYIRGY